MRLCPLLIACALALPGRGEAAAPPRAKAWVLSFQYGGGHLGMDNDSLSDGDRKTESRKSGLGPQIRLGTILDSKTIAGIEARSWTSTGTDSLQGSEEGTTSLDRAVSIFVLTATVFPSGKGLYVRAGGGIATIRQEFLAHDPFFGPSETIEKRDSGFAVLGAAGWEQRVRPFLGVIAEAEYARFVADHIGGNLITGSIGLNIYW